MPWPRPAFLALAVLPVTAALVAACSAKHDPAPGEILLAIDANLKVPDDMDELGVSVMSEDGTVASIDHIYPMAPIGDAKFPATLAIVRGTSQPVDIKVAAFKAGSAFALRETVTTLPTDRTAILRIDLNWLDEGSTSGAVTQVQSLATAMPCMSGQTSVEGTCESFTLDSATLPTYTEGSLVPAADAGGVCLDVVDCMLGQVGAVIPPTPAPQPVMTTVPAPDGGVLPECLLAPPFGSAPFNVGMVPKSGAAGWCNGNGCVLPLENDVAVGWQASSVDGMVHLPLGVCTSTKIASLLLSQVNGGCPQYGAIAHPACQDYGADGGTISGEGGPRKNDGGGGGGAEGGADGGMTDGAPSNANIAVSDNPPLNDYPFVLGLAVTPDTGRACAFLENDAGATVVDYEPLNFGTPPTEVPATFNAGATSFAAGSDRVAVASGNAVQVYMLDGGADGGFYKGNTSVASIIYQPTAPGSRLVIAGLNGSLNYVEPNATAPTVVTNFNASPSLLAYDSTNQAFIVVAAAAPEQSLTYLTTLDGATPLPAPFASNGGSPIQAVAFADPQTAVWVDQDGTFFTASVSGDAGAALQLPISAGIADGATQVLTAKDGRVAWIGKNMDLWAARIVGGALADAPIDLSTRMVAPLNSAMGMNVTQVAVSEPVGELFWMNSGPMYPGYVFETPLAYIPQ